MWRESKPSCAKINNSCRYLQQGEDALQQPIYSQPNVLGSTWFQIDSQTLCEVMSFWHVQSSNLERLACSMHVHTYWPLHLILTLISPQVRSTFTTSLEGYSRVGREVLRRLWCDEKQRGQWCAHTTAQLHVMIPPQNRLRRLVSSMGWGLLWASLDLMLVCNA